MTLDTQVQSYPVGNAKLHAARKKVEVNWLPVNPHLLERIRDGLKSGAYDLDLDFLLSELRTDIALFLYCVKECRRRLCASAEGAMAVLSPEDLFRKAGLRVLRDVLTQPIDKFSTYAFDQTSELQLKRLRESMISASSAEVLAEEKDLAPELGFSTGLLRELGLSLIAWNYPEVYEDALGRLSSGARLDDEITKRLGFSPTLLAISLAKDWGLPSEIRVAMGDQEALDETPLQFQELVQNTASTLEKICEVGEALARANSPEIYPTAKADWAFAQEEMERSLGHDTFKHIQARVKENCASYYELARDVFDLSGGLDPIQRIEESEITDGFRQNRYVRYLPDSVRGELIEIYKEIDSSQTILRELVLQLARETIPHAGFERGCIFLLEPTTTHLTPRLRIGAGQLTEFRSYHSLSMTTQASNPVLAAYHCNTPIIESDLALSREGRSCIAGVLGLKQRIGVLYLEPTDSLAFSRDSGLLMRFKALALAVQDILHVE